MRRQTPLMVAIVGVLLTVACKEGPVPELPAAHLLKLAQDVNGDLDCVAPAEATCANLPYDGDCLVLEIEVDPRTGRTCQRCQLADGTMIDQGCGGSVVSCVLVTLPEPDCVVCAYLDGAVVFSTCTASAAAQCVDYQRADGSACQRCFDPAGRVVFDSCPPDCGTVICPALACADDLVPSRRPNECCARCEPVLDCHGIVCAQDFAIPACPAGTALVRDPLDCCGYLCQPNQCAPMAGAERPNLLPAGCASHLDCPEGTLCTDGMCGAGSTSNCPPGYVWRDDFPFCGQCVGQSGGQSCLADFDCGYDEYCAYDNATCGSAGDPQPGGGASAPAVCYGTCRPQNPVCEPSAGVPAPIVPCDGTWSLAYDVAGCPTPICVCPDGSQSLDGICRDLCANVDCFAAPTFNCDPGFHVETRYPYCCGVCVPDDVCAYVESGAAPQSDAPFMICPEVACAYGFHPETDPVTCCPTCMPDVTDGCLSSNECGFGFYCSTEDGACGPPPGCEPDSGACFGVCYGQCLPTDDQTRADCFDSDGGLEPYLPGAVTASSAGVSEVVADTCTADGTAVIEQYCYTRSDGRYRQSVTVQCNASAIGMAACIDGACR